MLYLCAKFRSASYFLGYYSKTENLSVVYVFRRSQYSLVAKSIILRKYLNIFYQPGVARLFCFSLVSYLGIANQVFAFAKPLLIACHIWLRWMIGTAQPSCRTSRTCPSIISQNCGGYSDNAKTAYRARRVHESDLAPQSFARSFFRYLL